MKVVFVAFGSRGDVQPCVALGVELQKRGCQVSLVSHGAFEKFAREYGLDFQEIPGDVTVLLKKVTNAGISMTRFALAWSNYFRAMLPDVEPIVLNACRGADVVLFTPLSSMAYHAAEATGARAIRMSLQPFYPTRSAPHFMTPALPLGGGYNLFTHQLTELTAHWSLYREFNLWRKKLGLPTMRPFETPYFKQNGRWLTTLHAYSPNLIPPATDWGAHVHVTGFWELAQAHNWQPPHSLLDFLESGDPPTYIGFGSMMDDEFHHLTEIAARALKDTGQRGILLGGWGGLTTGKSGDHIYPLAEAPHDWLFPLMAAAVHHGGVGTLAASLKAGLPTEEGCFMDFTGSLVVLGFLLFFGFVVYLAVTGFIPPVERKMM